ncbi:hypothetical protein BB560_000441, partial [Smittium megazygosporum]
MNSNHIEDSLLDESFKLEISDVDHYFSNQSQDESNKPRNDLDYDYSLNPENRPDNFNLNTLPPKHILTLNEHQGKTSFSPKRDHFSNFEFGAGLARLNRVKSTSEADVESSTPKPSETLRRYYSYNPNGFTAIQNTDTRNTSRKNSTHSASSANSASSADVSKSTKKARKTARRMFGSRTNSVASSRKNSILDNNTSALPPNIKKLSELYPNLPNFSLANSTFPDIGDASYSFLGNQNRTNFDTKPQTYPNNENVPAIQQTIVGIKPPPNYIQNTILKRISSHHSGINDTDSELSVLKIADNPDFSKSLYELDKNYKGGSYSFSDQDSMKLDGSFSIHDNKSNIGNKLKNNQVDGTKAVDTNLNLNFGVSQQKSPVPNNDFEVPTISSNSSRTTSLSIDEKNNHSKAQSSPPIDQEDLSTLDKNYPHAPGQPQNPVSLSFLEEADGFSHGKPSISKQNPSTNQIPHSLNQFNEMMDSYFVANEKGPPTSLFESVSNANAGNEFSFYHNNQKLENEGFIYKDNISSHSPQSDLLTESNEINNEISNLVPESKSLDNILNSPEYTDNYSMSKPESPKFDPDESLPKNAQNISMNITSNRNFTAELDSADLKELGSFSVDINSSAHPQLKFNDKNNNQLKTTQTRLKHVRVNSEPDFIEGAEYLDHDFDHDFSHHDFHSDNGSVLDLGEADESFEKGIEGLESGSFRNNSFSKKLNTVFSAITPNGVNNNEHISFMPALNVTSNIPTQESPNPQYAQTPYPSKKMPAESYTNPTSNEKSAKSIGIRSVFSDSTTTPFSNYKISQEAHSSNPNNKANFQGGNIIKNSDLENDQAAAYAENTGYGISGKSLLEGPIDFPILNQSKIPQFLDIENKSQRKRSSYIDPSTASFKVNAAIGTTPSGLNKDESETREVLSQSSSKLQNVSAQSFTNVNNDLQQNETTDSSQKISQTNYSNMNTRIFVHPQYGNHNNFTPTTNTVYLNRRPTLSQASLNRSYEQPVLEPINEAKRPVADKSVSAEMTSQYSYSSRIENNNNNFSEKYSSGKRSSLASMSQASGNKEKLSIPPQESLGKFTKGSSKSPYSGLSTDSKIIQIPTTGFTPKNQQTVIPADTKSSQSGYNRPTSSNNERKSTNISNKTTQNNSSLGEKINANRVINQNSTPDRTAYSLQLTPSKETDKFLMLSEDQIHSIALLIQSRLENSINSLLELDRNLLQNEIAIVKDQMLKSTESYQQLKSFLPKIGTENNTESHRPQKVSNLDMNKSFADSSYFNRAENTSNKLDTEHDTNASVQSTVGVTSSSSISAERVAAVLEMYKMELKKMLSERNNSTFSSSSPFKKHSVDVENGVRRPSTDEDLSKPNIFQSTSRISGSPIQTNKLSSKLTEANQ